ncbi:hypothetical protein D3C86_2102110 [compost metagenome]
MPGIPFANGFIMVTAAALDCTVFPFSVTFAVICEVPSFNAVMLPCWLTVTAAGLLEL